MKERPKPPVGNETQWTVSDLCGEPRRSRALHPLLVGSYLLFMLTGCEAKPEIERTNKAVVSGGPTISTVEYDGHKFIWAQNFLGGGAVAGNLIHHPDCRCLK